MWVISVGRHLSRTLKKSHAPAEDRTGNPSIYSQALYHVAIKADLYRKAVQVYYIPNLYPVTLLLFDASDFSSLLIYLARRKQIVIHTAKVRCRKS